MLSISLMKAADYYLDAIGANYYLEGGEPPGEWFGKGAALLGLNGTVKDDDFRKVFDGFDPSPDAPPGAKLVQNAGNRNRQSGWDLTFSAPKSVSVLWSQADESVRMTIEACADRAVKETLAHIESTIAYSRTGKAGKGERKKVNLTIAMFQQGTSRAGDPCLHHHCPVMNVGIDDQGDQRAIVSKLFFQHKMLGGAYYRAAFARNLEVDLGVRCNRVGNCFEIEGVPSWISDLFSKRRKQVLDEMAKRGVQGAKAAAFATLISRPKKEEIPPRKELFERWRKEVDDSRKADRSLEKFSSKKIVGKRQRNRNKLLKEAVDAALENLTRVRAHFVLEDLFREALFVAPEYGLGPTELLDATQKLLAEGKTIVRLDSFAGERYTTMQNLKDETELIQLAAELARRGGAKAKARTVKATHKKRTTPDEKGRKLNEEQERGFLHLVESRSGIRFLHGLAGTGKTSFTLRACIDAWKKDGYEVLGAAPTAKAAGVLQSDAGVPCNTIHSFLGDFEIGKLNTLKHDMEQYARVLAGQKTRKRFKPKPTKLTRKSILVIDEAGMVNLRHYKMLLEHVKKANATIVFIGDPYQLPPVDGTAPFKSLSRLCGYAELTDIQRQEQQWARDASHHFYMGEPGKALRLFAKHERLVVAEDEDDAIVKLVKQWATTGISAPEKSVVICSKNRDCDRSNELCQKQRIDAKQIGQSAHTILSDRRDDGVHETVAYVDDRVLFTQNLKSKGIQNGAQGTITRIVERIIHVRLDSGHMVTLDINKYQHLRLGYALTTYKSQGTTFEHSYMLAGGDMQDLPTSYVQATRAKKDSYIFTTKKHLDEYLDDIEDSCLAEQMGRRPDLSLATDFVFAARDQDTDRAALISRLVQDYLNKLKAPNQNHCMVVPSPVHAEGLNLACHVKLAKQSATKATSGNGKELVVGDKVVFQRDLPSQWIKGRRATVTEVDANGIVELRLDEKPPLASDDMVVAKADQLSIGYAHALTVAEANQTLRNCPQPHILLDSPPLFSEFLDVTPAAEESVDARKPKQKNIAARPTRRSWVMNLVKNIEQTLDERDLRRLRLIEYDRARRAELRDTASEEEPMQAQPHSQTQEHWSSNWQLDSWQSSGVGLSSQVFTPSVYNSQAQTQSYAVPTTQSGFDYTFAVIAGGADHQQKQQQLQALQQAQQLFQQQVTQSVTQTQVQTLQQSGW